MFFRKKGVIALLLCASLLLASCGGAANTTTSESDADTTSNVSEESAANVEIPADATVPVQVAQKSLSSVDRTRQPVNLAEKRSYTCTASDSSEYPDNGAKLTDGLLRTGYDKEHWVGYLRADTFTITVDLGAVETDLADLTVALLVNTSMGIGAPIKITFSVSDDGKNYKKLGSAYPPVENGMHEVGLKLAHPVQARFVSIEVGASSSAWIFLGEIYVLKYAEDTRAGYYGNQSLPAVSGRDEWPASEQSDTVCNLILGKKPLIKSKDSISVEFMTEYYNSLVGIPRLTDGQYASAPDYGRSEFVHFTRATGRSLYFDLGHTSAVSGVGYAFLEQAGPAIHVPNLLSVSLSEDGIGWQTVYVDESLVSESEQCLFNKKGEFDHTYIARFVRIDFTVNTHVYCDELQIYGTKAIPADAVTIVPGEEYKPDAIGYVQPEDFLGVHNVMLSYHCIDEDGGHSERGLITKEEYLPYVGYYDKDGKLVDTFFDGFLYLPYAVFNNMESTRTLEGWKFYVDDIYAPDRNMAALDAATAEVAGELGLTGYKSTVFTSVLYPWKTTRESKVLNTFGDLNGDGKNESFDSLENRKQAVKWLMKQEYDRFCAGNYENLTFGGFYWFEENIMTNSVEEKELIRFASDYAHELGTLFFWIPYYCASGYDRWQEYGFDVACMQPNFMFQNSRDLSVLQSTAEKTEQLGMCVEMEINDVSNHEEVQRYMKYLQAGVKFGFMNAVKMYYQVGVPGAFYHAWASRNAFERSVYDLTYLYAKEKLTADLPEHTFHTDPYVCTGEKLMAKQIAKSDTTYQFRLTVSPEHGDLRLNGNGTFIYYPRDGYTGIDRFSVVLDFGYAESEELIVTVAVQ